MGEQSENTYNLLCLKLSKSWGNSVNYLKDLLRRLFYAVLGLVERYLLLFEQYATFLEPNNKKKRASNFDFRFVSNFSVSREYL